MKDEIVAYEEFQPLEVERYRDKRYKILSICTKSLDHYMIKKFLPKEEGFVHLEARTFHEALKIVSYVHIDLVLVDDRVDELDLETIMKKMAGFIGLQHVPKIFLLSNEYDRERFPKFSKNIDFLKKPMSESMLRHRVMLHLEREDRAMSSRSFFRQQAYRQFFKANRSLSLYQEIFDKSEQMMLIYSPKEQKFMEVNQAFENFFTNVRLLNRIFCNKRVMKQFVPPIDNPAYLNYYLPQQWFDEALVNREFHFTLRVHLSYHEYSFSVMVDRLESYGEPLYLIKLISMIDYMPSHDRQKSGSEIKLKEGNLASFKEDFLTLRSLLYTSDRPSKKVDEAIMRLSSKLSIVCDDSSIVEDGEDMSRLNFSKKLYDALEQHSYYQEVTINSHTLEEFDPIEDPIFITVDSKQLDTLIEQLLIEEERVDILLYETTDMVIVEVAYGENKNFDQQKMSTDLEPTLTKLEASMEIYEEQQKHIIVINLPKKS